MEEQEERWTIRLETSDPVVGEGRGDRRAVLMPTHETMPTETPTKKGGSRQKCVLFFFFHYYYYFLNLI